MKEIQVWVDGERRENATYGLARDDRTGAVGWEWHWNTSSYANGIHTVEIRAIGSDGQSAILAEAGTGKESLNINVQNRYHFADVNGDNRDDSILIQDDWVTVQLSTGDGVGDPNPWTEQPYYGTRGTFFADVTGDGMADAIVVNNSKVTVRRSTGTSFAPNEHWTNEPYYGTRGTFFADVTGDGMADAIVVNNSKVTVRRSTGTSFAPNEYWTNEPYYGTRGTFFADVTGDGMADAIVVNNSRVVVRRSTGSAFDSNEHWTERSYYGTRGTFFADVTGDGMADAIVINDDKVTVRRSSGTAFPAPQEQWTDEPYYGRTGGTLFADMTGDSRADAIAINTPRVTIRRSTGTLFSPNENWITTAPDIPTCGVSIEGAANFTGDPEVTIRLLAAGADEMQISNDGGFAGAEWQPYAATQTWTLNDPGQRIATVMVYARFRDSSDAMLCGGTLSDDIIIDPLPPTVEVQILPDTEEPALAEARDYTLQLTSSDQEAGSGVTEMRIGTDTSFHEVKSIPFTEQTTIRAEPGQTIYVMVMDSVGNTSEIATLTASDGTYQVYLPMIIRQ